MEIINSGNANPDKFVAMIDIELLVLPEHLVRQHLLQREEAIIFKHPDIKVWLDNYFSDKYRPTEIAGEKINTNIQ